MHQQYEAKKKEQQQQNDFSIREDFAQSRGY